MSRDAINLAVLVSGGGTTLQNLLDRIADHSLSARVRLVIGSRTGLGAETRAMGASLPYAIVARRKFSSIETFSNRVFDLVDAANVDLVCLAGWLSLLRVPDRWMGRVMNIHPALLPSFGGKGMHGRHVHESVLAHGCKVSGCTVHFVNNEYDAGPIIVQRCCPVLDDDTPETLATRVFEQECLAYPEAIRLFAAGRLRIDGRIVRVVDEK